MAAEFRLGIQSYCFRKFLPLPDLIGALKQAALSYVEVWPRHIPFDAPAGVQAEALATLKKNGITPDSYGVIGFDTDEAKNRKIFDFARRAGLRAVSADPHPDALGSLESLSDEYGVNLAVHNHGRKHRYGRFDQLDELFAKTSPRVGLCLDTAWLLQVGQDPVEALHRYEDRVYGVHLKDFVFDAEGRATDVIIGTGGLNLPAFMETLKRMGFHGYLSLEYEGDADSPLPKVKECIAAVRTCLAGP
jgi:sugar phosphate isomerase/epimerase